MSLSQIDLLHELTAQLDVMDPDEGDRIEFSMAGEGMVLVMTDVRADFVDGNQITKVELTYATADNPHGQRE